MNNQKAESKHITRVEKAQIAIENTFGGISAILICIMMVITTLDVFLRYLFNRPLHDVFHLCEMMMVGVVYLAIAYVQQRKGHVRVDLVLDKLSGKSRTILEMSVLIISLAAFIIVLWQSSIYTWDAWETKDHTMGVIEYPLWPAQLILTIGVAFLCLRFMTDIKNHFFDLHNESRHWLFWSVVAIAPLALMASFLTSGSFGLVLEPMTIGWIIMGVMVVLLFGGMPVSFALLVLGIVGYWMIAGPAKTFTITGIVPYDKISNYTLSVIPLFIFMGHLSFHAGFADSLYKTAQKWIGHIPGSLAQATVVGGAAFGAACGSGLASCATLARICIPAMERVGIDRKLALGTVAGAGTIAQMIPPSVLMVLYAIITEQSVAKLLIAGIIPGIVAAANYIIMIYVRCRLNPELAPRIMERVSWKARVFSLKDSWGVALLALIVMGGIYSGVFTPTEAGALGAFGALSLGLMTRKLNHKSIHEALVDSAKTAGMIFLIIAAAMLFGYFLGISRIPANVSDYIVGLEVHRFVILLGILLMYVVAGFFIDMLAFAFLTLPIVFPVITALEYDPLWFGVITVHMFEVSLITPPFGLNLFILRGMVPGISMRETIQGVMWFFVMDMVTLAMYVAFPQLATWLPSLM